MELDKDVVIRAIDAGMKGDVEALWVAKLLLTSWWMYVPIPQPGEH